MTFMDEIVGIIHGDVIRKRREQRDAWVALARAEFRPSERKSCCVCDKHYAITHAHHLVPLNWQYKLGLERSYHSHAWLCPNHHAILHAFLDGDEASKEMATAIHLVSDCSKDERTRLHELYENAHRLAKEIASDD